MIIRLIKMWIMGIAITAPVGPIGVVAFEKRLRATLAVGLGAALADAMYGVCL